MASAEVVDFFSEYERESADLDTSFRELERAILSDTMLLHELETAVQTETPPDPPKLERLYGEAGVVLPGVALRRYEEVRVFHEAVIHNRRAHLADEIKSIQGRIEIATKRREEIQRRMSEVAGVLDSGISRGHFLKVSTELSAVDTEIHDLERRYKLAQDLQQTTVDLQVEQANAQVALQNDLAERAESINEAISVFQEISAALYKEPARFNIEPSKDGPRFRIEKSDIGSAGIYQMQIFTFDLTMAVMCARRAPWPKFLVHDSHIFDGVDGRQTASALEAGDKWTKQFGGQYIVTMNSDELAKVMKESGKNFDWAIIEPRLTDTDTGGLFDFKFEFKEPDGGDERASPLGG